METKEQEQPAEDIIERRGEEEVSAMDEISMTNVPISDDLCKKTLAGSDEETRFEFVEEKLCQTETSIESDKWDTEDNTNIENSEGGISTDNKGSSETQGTNEAVTPDTTVSSPNSQRSTEKNSSTEDVSKVKHPEEVAVEKAEESESKPEKEGLLEIQRQNLLLAVNILLAVTIFFLTSIRDFFVDSKYFLSKCTLPNSHGIALLR